MKGFICAGVFLLLMLACNTSQNTVSGTTATASANDTVRIANDSLEYEVIIIDPGFNTWMASNARPRNQYTQQYLETRNRVWVNEWNNRAMMPGRRNAETFTPINYQSTVDYGFEVNYMIFNYLTYFQMKNNIRLGGFVPRI
ncbi:MAG TPA: DUF6146 family protein [Flavobacterium sp.]